MAGKERMRKSREKGKQVTYLSSTFQVEESIFHCVDSWINISEIRLHPAFSEYSSNKDYDNKISRILPLPILIIS
jgi:hypothetical protein